jgi:hypothetical protein
MGLTKEDAGMIVQDYRLEKNKEEQIKIMSQLYAISTAEIRGILYRAGEYKVSGNAIRQALKRLQTGGKNNTLGTLRLWFAAFKDCSSKQAKRILQDYREMPWDGAIPDEEFRKALEKKDEDEVEIMAAGPEPEPEKPAEKTDVEPRFSAEEQKMIIYGLTRLYVEKDQEWRKMKENADEKKRKLEEAEAEYKTAKEAEDLAAASMADLEALIGRLQAEEPEQKADDLSEQLWSELSGEK